MQRLITGVHQFRRTEFGRYRELFRALAQHGQRPHSLFITCSDSRVIGELITQSNPGDLFVVKNPGNIVPRMDAKSPDHSTAAAIEFAVDGLKVSDIVVCGHSQCGAMDALAHGLPGDQDMPNLVQWLEHADPVRQLIRQQYVHLVDPTARTTATAEENVLFALENLHTYPCVQRGLREGALHLHGWFFKIATAELFAYDPDQNQFAPLHATEPPGGPRSGV